MPRSIWSGAISFGLVNVPVKLYSAVSRKTVRFNQLNSETGNRIAQKRVDPETGEEVPFDQIVKGFELTKDRYVIVTPDELDALDPERTRTVDIEDFVDLAEIDPIYYDHPYYLVPDKGSAKAYGLLLNAMEASGKVAIARVVLRSKEQLVAIRPAGDLLMMEQTQSFSGLYFVLNTGLIAVAIAFEQRHAPWQVWREHCSPLWLTYFGGAAAAGLTLLLVSTRNAGFGVLTFVAPIPFIIYASFKTAVARMQDHVAHLGRVNSMYLATIETLAQAIDAKDEVTHDHIRRVQRNAMRLARQLGITDDGEVRALEAASLLHDMGKLAVPEHILNKPDKLTPAEFDRMKEHAAIGADILSPIGFPFPVVPIVRHHHENWDGTGYPDGLKGPAIPIGARILSVVDCFDALTSDRPYRKALSTERAIQIIVDRSGVMYDPAVVAAFLHIKDELLEECESTSGQHAFDAIARARQTALEHSPLDSPAVTSAMVMMAGRLGRSIGGSRELASLCDSLHEQLASLRPGVTLVIFQHDPQLDALVAHHASGPHSEAIKELTIGVGLRLTGWVAAHRSTIVNSEAALDLGNLATKLQPTPQLCLSAHMAVGTEMVGALTAYSTVDRPFTANEVSLLEMLACLLAPIVRNDATARAVRREHEPGRLPAIEQVTPTRRALRAV